MVKAVTVFFDLEGWYETPYREQFNLDKTVEIILNILKKYDVKAVFNTLGIVAKNFPLLLKKIDEEGHEIASHGYFHENFIQLNLEELNSVLQRTEKAIEDAIGKKPIGIRSPWLFHNSQVYDLIKKRGYKWVSNKRFHHKCMLERPDIASSSQNPLKIIRNGIIWFRGTRTKRIPFKTQSLIEIPLLSSMDGELLSLFNLHQNSPANWLEYAYNSLCTQYDDSKEYFNLNFHPWMIGTKNRPILLDQILQFIKENNNSKYLLAKEIEV